MQITDVAPSVEKPNDETHGDFSSNIAMKLSATLSLRLGDKKKNPFEIAEQIVEKLETQSNKLSFIEKFEAVNPDGLQTINSITEAIKKDMGYQEK